MTKTKEEVSKGKLTTMSTKGEGDCAFHAMFGDLDGSGQYVFSDVVGKRQALAKAIREHKKEDRIKPFVNQAIYVRIMDKEHGTKRPEMQKALDAYEAHKVKNDKGIAEAWMKLEEALHQDEELKKYIATWLSEQKQDLQDNLKKDTKTIFQTMLNTDGGLLLSMIL